MKGRGKAAPEARRAVSEAESLRAEVAARTEAAMKTVAGGIGKAEAFSKAGARSLRRDPTGERLAAGARRAARISLRLALACASLVVLLVLLPPFVWPVRGHVSSSFFLRQKPDSGDFLDLEFHKGIDIAAPEGEPVIPSAPGVVAATGRSPTAGNYVIVRHLFGLESRYYHLESVLVAKGQTILLRGLSPIGRVGSTGRSTGPHLHFELDAGTEGGRAGIALPPRALLVFHGLRIAVLGF